MSKTVLFTHNDLDALGCVLNIKSALTLDKIFYTYYGDIEEQVSKIIDYFNTTKADNLIVADVSFAGFPKLLRELFSVVPGKKIFIDHHLYPDGFFDNLKNVFIKYNKDLSATLLCHSLFNRQNDNKKLLNLSKVIDTYDLWRKTSPYFKVAQDINTYFLEYRNHISKLGTPSIEELADHLLQNNFKFPDDLPDVLLKTRQTETEIYQQYRDHGILQRSKAGERITLIFGPDAFNHIMLAEMADGQDYVVGFCRGIVKVRIREEADCTPRFKNLMRFHLTGTRDIGHMNAFSYPLKEKWTLENIVGEAEKISKLINTRTSIEEEYKVLGQDLESGM